MRLIPDRLRLLVSALYRKLFAKPNIEGLDVWIVSPGGVGTTFLMEYIEQYSTTNDPHDQDGLKHWPRPPRSIRSNKNIKVIFIEGDPIEISASIARRQWTRTQAAKIGSLGGTLLNGTIQKNAFKSSVIKQIRCWKDFDSSNILIIDYNDLWNCSAKMGRHIGADVERFVEFFPERRERTVKSCTLSEL